MQDARLRWLGKGKQLVREQLLEPLFKKLGFKANGQQARRGPDEARLPAQAQRRRARRRRSSTPGIAGSTARTSTSITTRPKRTPVPAWSRPWTRACRLDHRDQWQAVAALQPAGPCPGHELLRGRSGRGACRPRATPTPTKHSATGGCSSAPRRLPRPTGSETGDDAQPMLAR